MKGVFDEGNYHQPNNLFVLTIILLQRIKKKKYQSLLSLMSIIKYTYFGKYLSCWQFQVQTNIVLYPWTFFGASIFVFLACFVKVEPQFVNVMDRRRSSHLKMGRLLKCLILFHFSTTLPPEGLKSKNLSPGSQDIAFCTIGNFGLSAEKTWMLTPNLDTGSQILG